MESIETDIRTWVAAQRDDIIEAISSSIAIPSVPSSLDQNGVHPLVAEAAGATDEDVDRWVPDWAEVASVPSPRDDRRPWIDLDAISPQYREILPELEVQVLSHRSGTGPTLVLNGHVDVVPAPPDGWTSPPFEPATRDGWLYDRGAMDMKAGLMAGAFAFRYLQSRRLIRGELALASVPEEETGGDGTLAVLHRGYIGDGVVFMEPSDLRVVHRHLGIQRFTVELTGRSGGILRRSWGTSVVPGLGKLLTRLSELEQERQQQAVAAGGYLKDDLPGFVNVGVVEAGEWVATRPGSAMIDGVMSALPNEDQSDAAAALESAVGELDLGEVRAQVKVMPGAHRGAEIPLDHPLVAAFAVPDAVEHARGGPSRAGTMVCDAKIVSGGGWAPSVVLGPIGEGLHSRDERVDIESVGECVVQLVLGATRYFGTDTG